MPCRMVSGRTRRAYPAEMNPPGKRALYDNLEKDETVALAVDAAVRGSRQDDWRSNPFKVKVVKNAIRVALELAGAQIGGGSDVTKGGIVREQPAEYGTQPSESLEKRG